MDQHDLESGVEIGDFRIESRLGAGGMGIVYRARQISLDRIVDSRSWGRPEPGCGPDAVPSQGAGGGEAPPPQYRRLALHRQVGHVCYMAMEFIDGLPLRDVIDRLAAGHDVGLTIDRPLGEVQPREAVHGKCARRTDGDFVRTADHPADDVPDDERALTPEARQVFASRSYWKRCCELGIEAALALGHAHERASSIATSSRRTSCSTGKDMST